MVLIFFRVTVLYGQIFRSSMKPAKVVTTASNVALTRLYVDSPRAGNRPDRLSVRHLRDLAEPANFDFVEATGSRFSDVVVFRNRVS
jgi:hypothetical protein